jgi:hypothetical protein
MNVRLSTVWYKRAPLINLLLVGYVGATNPPKIVLNSP